MRLRTFGRPESMFDWAQPNHAIFAARGFEGYFALNHITLH